MKIVNNLFMILMFGGTLLASDARVAALGGNAGFWADDDQNWTMFPHTINNLDLIQVTGAGNGTGSVGVIWGEGTTWGFLFDAAGDAEFCDQGLCGGGNDWINLAWGNGDMGVLVGLGMSSYDSGVEGSNASSNMNIDVGWGQNMDFGEVGVFFSTGSSDDGNSDSYEEGSMGLAANIRRGQSLWLFSDMLVGFTFQSTTNDNDMQDATSTDISLSVDLFTTLAMAEGVNAVFSMGFGYWSNAYDSGLDGVDVFNSSTISLPAITVGVEASVTDWATVRFGVNHSYTLAGTHGDETWSGPTSYQDFSYTYEMVDYYGNGTGEMVTAEEYERINNFGWNFGLGFDYGSFNLDMVLDSEGVFNNPGHYVTGRNEDALATSATLTYNF